MLDENVFVALDRPESIKLHENYKEDIGQGFSSEDTFGTIVSRKLAHLLAGQNYVQA